MTTVNTRRLRKPIGCSPCSQLQTIKTRPQILGYNPLSPYSEDDSTFANHLLCPRYAENDSTSAPPSPTELESFDVLDSIPWRRSYISLDIGAGEGGKYRAISKYYNRNRSRILAIIVMFILLVSGCALGAYLIMTRARSELREACIARSGAPNVDKCEQIKWAQCIVRNGFGFCEGYM